MAIALNDSTTFNMPIVVDSINNDIETTYATTEAQLEVWLSSQQSDQANCAYNEISSLQIKGHLDSTRLRKALDQVVSRHSSLRSTFSPDGLEVRVHKTARYEFTETDTASDNVVSQQANQPFDLANGPLLRIVLQRCERQDHKLTITAHHVVLDGWSLAVLVKELGYFYDQLGGVAVEPLSPATQYQQYAGKMKAYSESAVGQSDEAFWLNEFSQPAPVVDLPTDRKRPALRTYTADRYDHVLNAELVESIRIAGAKSGCSLFNVMLSAFQAFLARVSGEDDVCVGIPTAGQAAMDTPDLIGHCVNTLPFRAVVDSTLRFDDFLKHTRGKLLNTLEHQKYSYGTLLRKLAASRDPSRPALVSVSFNIDPVIDGQELGFQGLDVRVIVEPRSFENFEWAVNGIIESDRSVELQVQYNSDLFSRQSIEFYFEGFETFLSMLAKNPSEKIGDLPLMSIPQRQQVIVDWNQTPADFRFDSAVHGEFARQANVTPDNVAVGFAGRELTYAELESRSNQVARYLQSRGVVAGDLVGICTQRSELMLVYLLGIMKTGAAYVPLDPAYPTDRLSYMCDHSGLKLIVTQESLNDRVAGFNKPQIAIDAVAAEIQSLDSTPMATDTNPSDICYVIYTSGSTGKPKGVQVPHGAVVNFLRSMQITPGFTQTDSILAVTTLSFDIAVLELYLPLICGGKVIILDSHSAADGNELAQQLQQHDISMLQATPATWRLMIQSGWKGKQDLKVLCGGEPMPPDLVAPLLERCGELWNMYGPTETTVWSAAYQITDAKAPILIGKPIHNTQIYILDTNGNEVPIGCAGEVYIGGAGVTCGYRNRDDLTQERFVKNRYRSPFVDYVSDRLYKTGDLARFRHDGNIEFLRRNDKQVKVRGFRIELGEIESNLKSHPDVQQAVVIVREDTPGDTRLVAYLVANPDLVPSVNQLREHLRQSVPAYMVPQNFVQLETMPQTNNGKIDYKSLPLPTDQSGVGDSDADVEAPTTASEKYLAGIWRKILDLDFVDRNDVFFDIGGHSLLVMKVIAKVETETGVRLGPQAFLMSTLQQLASELESSSAEVPSPVDVADEPIPSNDDEDDSDVSPADSNSVTLKKGLIKSLKGFWD